VRSVRSVVQPSKVAIDRQARESENKKHEETLVVVLPASGRLRSQEAGCGTEPVATSHCRNHRTLRNSQAGKCQHGNLQLFACDHCYRFKNRAHQASLQENERRKMKSGIGLEGKSYFCSKSICDALVRSVRITDDSRVLLGEECHSDSHFFLIFLDNRLQK